MTKEITVNYNDELVDTLTAISIISKQLSRKIKEKKTMSKMKELNRLIHDMEETAKYYLRLVDEFKKLLSNDDETVPEPISPKSEPQREIQFEDVRAVLATKAKDGYKNEVRALLNAFGASSLSALTLNTLPQFLKKLEGLVMTNHAILSASASHRWLNCPPSVRLTEELPDTTSDFALEGTDAHELCAYLVEKALEKNARDPTEDLAYYNDEIQDCAEEYRNYVMEQVEKAKGYSRDPTVLV